MGKRNRKRVAWLLSASLVMTSLGVLPGNLAAADAPEVTTISDAAGFMDAVEQMREPNEGRKGKYRLTDDIILTSENIVEPVETFEGEFNGDGHKIKGLRVVKDGKPAALFTTLQNKARITNVTFAEINREETVSVSVDAEGLLAKKIQGEAEVSDVTFSSSSFAISKAASGGSVAVSSVGLLAGELDGEAEISNVKIESSQIVVQGADSVSAAGLLAGKVQGQVKVKGVAAVTGSAVTVDGASREVGGILGSISGERIGQCENHATVTCVKGEMVGGIVGHMSSTSVVSCENDGAVTGGKYVGGIAGKSDGGSASFTAVMNKGTIEVKKAADAPDNDAGKYAGGIAGEAGGRILHAGNTGDIRSEISADRYAADSAANPNPYIGGIAGKGNSLTIENSYTAGNIGDLTADALNAEGKFLNVFSTTGAGVTVKHLYFWHQQQNGMERK